MAHSIASRSSAHAADVRVVDTPHAGRALFAARAFGAGEDIFVEDAVAWQAGTDGRGALVSPGLSLDECDAFLRTLAPHYGMATSALSRAELAKAALDANAFGVGPAAASSAAGAYGQGGSARALFPLCAMVNHSCAPNARTFQAPGAAATPRRVLQARMSISAGEEITISYIPPTWHKPVRVARLTASYGFTCTCPRCAARHDDTIVLKCHACAHGRVFSGADACADCGAAFSIDAVAGAADASDADVMLAPISGGVRPRELVALLTGAHSVLAPEDVRLWLTAVDVLPQLAPAPSLHTQLRDAIVAAGARMQYVIAQEHGVE